MGAYLQLVTPGIPLLGAFLYHGVYDIGAYDFSCTSVFTNLTPTDAYRGAGPARGDLRHRAGDGQPRPPGRRRARRDPPAQLHPRRPVPRTTAPAGLVFDSGDYAGVPRRRPRARRLRRPPRRAGGAREPTASTKELGIGISTYVEMCGLAPSRVLASLNYSAGGWESATVRLLPTGKVEVVTGSTPHGQGHETCWSMIVADKFGIDPADVEVLHSDTAISPIGLDTYGSRSLAVGGVAIEMAADKVLAKARADRRPPARVRRGGPRVRRRRVPGAGHAHLGDGASRPSPSRRSPPTTSPTASSRTSSAEVDLRPAELHVPVRHPRLRRRGRHRDRRRRSCCATSPSTTAATRSTR